MLCLQSNASGSFLQTCINFVEQPLKFSHFEGEGNRLACKKNLDLVRDNKMFWKTISPYFVRNSKRRSEITLVDEKDHTLCEDKMIAEKFNEFFGNIVKKLNIPVTNEDLENDLMIQDPVKAAIDKYIPHLNILKIKNLIRIKSYFQVRHIDY